MSLVTLQSARDLDLPSRPFHFASFYSLIDDGEGDVSSVLPIKKTSEGERERKHKNLKSFLDGFNLSDERSFRLLMKKIFSLFQGMCELFGSVLYARESAFRD
jgi:hypothetical protein